MSTVTDKQAHERRMRLVHTLRSSVSWRIRKMMLLRNGPNATAEERARFQTNYRALAAVACAATYVEQVMGDDDEDLEFLALLDRRPSGALDLCPESMRRIAQFGTDPIPWEFGGPSDETIRYLLYDLDEAESKHRGLT